MLYIASLVRQTGALEYAAAAYNAARPHRRLESERNTMRSRARRVHSVHGNTRICCKSSCANTESLPDDLWQRAWHADRHWPRPLTDCPFTVIFLARARHVRLKDTISSFLRRSMTAPTSRWHKSPPMLGKAEHSPNPFIREMTRLALKHAPSICPRGFPTLPPRGNSRKPARKAISGDIQSIRHHLGREPLARRRCRKFERTQGVKYDPSARSLFCCARPSDDVRHDGHHHPGDEIVVFEPFYENYDRCDSERRTPRFVKLRTPDWAFDEKELAAAFRPAHQSDHSEQPKIPPAKFHASRPRVHSRPLRQMECYCITGRNLRAHLYDGGEHISMAGIDGMRDRHHRYQWPVENVQRYGMAGRLGCWLRQNRRNRFASADFLTVGAAAPLQQAGASALQLSAGLLRQTCCQLRAKRERLLKILTSAGFTVFSLAARNYIMTDIARFADPTLSFPGRHKRRALRQVSRRKNWRGRRPWLQLYNDARDGALQVRFTFAKKKRPSLRPKSAWPSSTPSRALLESDCRDIDSAGTETLC